MAKGKKTINWGGGVDLPKKWLWKLPKFLKFWFNLRLGLVFFTFHPIRILKIVALFFCKYCTTHNIKIMY